MKNKKMHIHKFIFKSNFAVYNADETPKNMTGLETERYCEQSTDTVLIKPTRRADS